jgi:hypothetical protein
MAMRTFGPSLKASSVGATCSPTEFGTAGFFSLVGKGSVIAAQMMQGLPFTSVILRYP